MCGGQSGSLVPVEYLIAANMLTAVFSPLTKRISFNDYFNHFYIF